MLLLPVCREEEDTPLREVAEERALSDRVARGTAVDCTSRGPSQKAGTDLGREVIGEEAAAGAEPLPQGKEENSRSHSQTVVGSCA